MKQPDIAFLRRKLLLLNYAEHLDDTSAELVERLVDDLIHTTESYRDLKLQLELHRGRVQFSIRRFGRATRLNLLWLSWILCIAKL